MNKFNTEYKIIVEKYTIDEGLEDFKISLFFKNKINYAILESLLIFAKNKDELDSLIYKELLLKLEAYPNKLKQIIETLGKEFNLTDKQKGNLEKKFKYILNLLILNKAPKYATHVKLRDENAFAFIQKSLENVVAI